MQEIDIKTYDKGNESLMISCPIRAVISKKPYLICRLARDKAWDEMSKDPWRVVVVCAWIKIKRYWNEMK